MSDWKTNRISYALLLTPVFFVCHFLEESPGFVAWFNSHVTPGITQELFWTVNISGLIITIFVVGIEWFSRSSFSLLLAAAWFSFLMFANGTFHIAASLFDKRYVPGFFTAAFLYIPFYIWLFTNAVKSKRTKTPALIAAAVFGSLPMFLHCYLILFRGSRLV